MGRVEGFSLGISLLGVGLLVIFALSPGVGLGLALGGIALMRFGATGRRPSGHWPRLPTSTPPSAPQGNQGSEAEDLSFDWHRRRNVITAVVVLVPLAAAVVALAVWRAEFHVTSAGEALTIVAAVTLGKWRHDHED